jgi:hypothetical protein
MPTRFQVSREDRSPDHPTGWVPIAMFGSLRKAELNVKMREAMNPWLYSDKNPDRLFHAIEAC